MTTRKLTRTSRCSLMKLATAATFLLDAKAKPNANSYANRTIKSAVTLPIANKKTTNQYKRLKF